MSDETKVQTGTIDPVEDELGRLRARVAALEAEIMTMKAREHLLNEVLDHSPSVIFVKSATDRRYMLVNKKTTELYGKSRDSLIGTRDDDYFPPEVAKVLREQDDAIIRNDNVTQFEEAVPFEGKISHYLTVKFPVRGLQGELVGVCGIATDISEQKQQEAVQIELKERVILAQNEALRELSSPIMPIANGVLAMPLVGSIDERRAEQIMQTLLEGIGAQSAHTVILDITGVRMLDATAATAVVSSARAAGLVGARVVLTGIQPNVAKILVELGIDLGDIITRSTLQSGVAYALSARR